MNGCKSIANGCCCQEIRVNVAPCQVSDNRATFPTPREGLPGHAAGSEGDEAQLQLQPAEMPEDSHASRSSRLYPNSFQTADVKHVVDNLLSECLDSMQTLHG